MASWVRWPSAALQEVERVNLNSQGDMHISFVAKHLEVSPCQRYLLVSTDGGRIIMMNTATWKQVQGPLWLIKLIYTSFSHQQTAFPACHHPVLPIRSRKSEFLSV